MNMSEDDQYTGSVQAFPSLLTKNLDPRRDNEYHDEEMERQRMKVVSLFFLP